MKVFVRSEYGPPDVLRLQEAEEPVVGDGDVLVRIRAASVNPADRYVLRGRPWLMRLMMGVRRPKSRRLGQDLAGEVVAVGRGFTRFRRGDEVFGAIRDEYDRDIDRAFGEYARTSEDLLVHKPARLSFEEAAAAPLAGLTALQGLRDNGRLAPGQRVLITGASGGVGTFAVQIAKAIGAHVTAACSTSKIELVRSIGADEVVDYTKGDFLGGDARFDLFFDVAATRPVSQCRRVLTADGAYVWAGAPDRGGWLGPMGSVFRVKVWEWIAGKRRVSLVTEKPTQADLVALAALMESGQVTPVIDRRYPLADVPEAIRYLELGHARGKVVITV